MKLCESGYGSMFVMLILALCVLMITSFLGHSSSEARTTYATKVRTERYYEAETAIHEVMSWLRLNSQSLVTPFRHQEFYTRFDRTDPAVGSNDTGVYTVPTKVKLKGTNTSAILTNDASLATAAFPPTENITTNTSYNAISSFSSAALGVTKVRMTLVDVIPVIASKDYGDPALGNAAPDTDFYPVYQVDAMNNLQEGTHIYATIIGDVVNLYDMGIYGQDYLEIRQACDSFNSNTGSYSAATKQAGCVSGSNSTAAVHKNEEVYGVLKTNGSIEADPPYGGETCADFTSGCPNKGETCAGEDCGVPLLDTFDTWSVYCPTNKGDLTVSVNTTLTITDSVPADPEVLPVDRCWDTVTVANNTTLTLSAVNSPYFFKTLTLQNNSNSSLNIAPSTSTGKVEVYVETITGNAFNGNQMINATGKPTQFSLFYLGTYALTLNGNVDMNAAIVSPQATLNVQGNFAFNGALLAKSLVLTGSGQIHYDEALGGTGVITDVQYLQGDIAQIFR